MKVDRQLFTYEVKISCGCTPLYRVAPPSKGDIITCVRHGAQHVLSRKVVKRSGDNTNSHTDSVCA
jgi:hypothetical protein